MIGLLLCSTALASALAIPGSSVSEPGGFKSEKRDFLYVGYLPEYRVASLNPSSFKSLTDVIYFSIEPNSDGTLSTAQWSPETIQTLNAIKTPHPLRHLIALGGWERSAGFAPMAQSATARARFIANLTQFCVANKLDGIDYDWEHPKNADEEKAYATLIVETKRAFAPLGLLVSLTVATWQNMPTEGFQAADRVQAMAYDNDGKHSTFTQAKQALDTLAGKGAPKERLVLGVPFYGRKIANGDATTYSDIVAKYHPTPEVDEVDGIYFNGIDTIQAKTRYALDRGYGGVMCWELGQDTADKSSLGQAIRDAVAKGAGKDALRKAEQASYSKETFAYKTVDGLKILADVYRRPGKEKRPVLLWIHGGALISGSRSYLREDQLERYLDGGFTVVSIDYRLAPETKLDSIVQDVQDAYEWVREKGPGLFSGDANRIAVAGQSAGAYLTLTAGYRFQPRPRALVSISGYGDVAGPWYSRPDPFYSGQAPISKEDAVKAVGNSPLSQGGNARYRFYVYCRQQGLWPREVAGHDPDAEPRFFDAFCPVRNVSPDYPPTLLLHGDHDTDVPYDQSVQMAEALERHHIEHELITVPKGDHNFETANGGLHDPANKERFDKVVAFLKSHLK